RQGRCCASWAPPAYPPACSWPGLRPNGCPRRWAYPVVAKLQAASLLHKSDIGGVVLGIASDQQLREAVQRLGDIAREHGIEARGVLVEPMQPFDHELLLGLRRDPRFGATLTLGRDGIDLLVLRSAAPTLFCAGGDIEEFALGAAALERQGAALRELMAAMARCPLPLLAVARGKAAGAGVILLAMTDLVIAAQDLSLACPEMAFSMYPVIVQAALETKISAARAPAMPQRPGAGCGGGARPGAGDRRARPRRLRRAGRAAPGLLRRTARGPGHRPQGQAGDGAARCRGGQDTGARAVDARELPHPGRAGDDPALPGGPAHTARGLSGGVYRRAAMCHTFIFPGERNSLSSEWQPNPPKNW
ncbi:acetate--CoA ligase family protein, partial [Bordetella pertussis]|uniref:acetate--CoA ligase family protein n=1 Tax=Bordetella pertussis TaxID=520 RepID=UPI001F51BE0F